jgi:formiminotetrahydrofolate cyclodeaminase
MSTTEHLIADDSLGELLESLAAQTPAPGGGTAAAVAGAIGAGLVEMAARFTLAREEYAERHVRVGEVRERAHQLRERLSELADDELHTYEPVLEASRLAPGDPDRARQLREALSAAADSPLALARSACEVAELAAELSRTGNVHLTGDAITGALLAEAACGAGARLVEINLAQRTEDGRVAEARGLAQRAAAARAKAMEGAKPTGRAVRPRG